MAKLRTDSERCQEKAYWAHFKDQKFSRIFKPEYRTRLLIPQTFATNFSTTFETVVKVCDPSKIVWEFGLMKRSNAVFFDQGWSKFVDAHSLQEHDILIFTYVGQMRFNVLIFQSQTSCEKISSYFLEGMDAEDEETKFGQSSSSGHGIPFPTEVVGCLSQCSKQKKLHKEDAIGQSKEKTDYLLRDEKTPKRSGLRLMRSANQEMVQSASEVPQILECLKSPSARTSGLSSQKTPNTNTEWLSDTDDVKVFAHSVEPTASLRSVVPDQPTQTNKEALLAELRKQKALQLAYASAKGIWSVYIMRQSYISQGFSMTLGTKWARQYLPSNSQDIILRTNSQIWDVRFYRKGTGYALTGGWKKFAMDNDLQEDDVCVFSLDTAAFAAVTLDVAIFRPRDMDVGENAVSEASLGHANQNSARAKKRGKLLLDEEYELL